VGSAAFNFSIQVLILTAFTAVRGQFPTGTRWLYAVLGLAVLVTFGTALALLLAALNVYLRDIQYLIEIAIMILFWASPVVYSWALVSGELSPALQQLYLANPMTLVVIAFQQTFWVAGDGQPVPPDLVEHLTVALLVSIVLLWVCQRVFARLQSNFAQEL
jgi:ABC-2 type transport system permease protein